MNEFLIIIVGILIIFVILALIFKDALRREKVIQNVIGEILLGVGIALMVGVF